MRLETGFYNEIREQVAWPWLQRVENRVGPGTPDCDFIASKRRGWLELKREHVLRPEHCLSLRKEQVPWHLDYARAGGDAWIALLAGRQYFLWRGEHARRLKNQPLRETADLAEVWGGKVEFYQWLRAF